MTKTNWTGDFTAVAPGTAYVTVRTYNGKEASCKVVVSAGKEMIAGKSVADWKKVIKAEADSYNGNVNITMWCSNADAKTEKAFIDEFRKKFSDSSYKLNIKVNSVYGSSTAANKIMESPKNGADIFCTNEDTLNSLFSSRSILPVASVFQSSVKNEHTSDSVNVVTENNTMLAFPKSCDEGYFMYYDKRVFSNSDTATLEGMISKAASKGTNVFYDLGNAWYSTGIFLASGTAIRNNNGTMVTNFDSTSGLNGAKAMCSIAKKSGKGFIGSSGTAGDDSVILNGFKDGYVRAAVTGSWMGPDLKNAIGASNLGAVKMPSMNIGGKQTQLHSFGGYQVMCVNAYAKCPVTSQLLAYYLTSGNVQLKRYNSRGTLPTAKSALANNAVKNDPVLKAIQAQRPYAHSLNSTVNGIYWASNIGVFGDDIVSAKGNFSDAQLKAIPHKDSAADAPSIFSSECAKRAQLT